MKKLLIIALLLSLTGCKKETHVEETSKEKVNIFEEKEEKPRVPKTIIEEMSMEIDDGRTYELIYDGNVTLEVNNRYLINETALIFNSPIKLCEDDTTHFSGEFRYTHNGDNYILKLNNMYIDFFHMATGGENFFQVNAKDNKVTYWLYSKGEATLTINKIWRFVPNGD